MVKAASEALSVPLLTPIVMFAKLPTLTVAGVPDNWPVLELKVAQAG
jgi:hypothetical protein